MDKGSQAPRLVQILYEKHRAAMSDISGSKLDLHGVIEREVRSHPAKIDRLNEMIFRLLHFILTHN